MNKLILIKLGGSLITDKNKIDSANYHIIGQLSEEIKTVIEKDKNLSLVIATGAGGFGHPVAEKYKHDLKKGLPEIKWAVKKINQLVVESLNKIGIKSKSVEPSKISEYKNGEMVRLLNGSIIELLNKNVIPVFHADLVNDKAKGISILSMDKFLVDLVIELKQQGREVTKVIFCGTTNGVLDDEGKTINKINQSNFSKIKKYFFENNHIDTSGGMRGKVEQGLKLADKNFFCLIINGIIAHNLARTILREENTGTAIGDFYSIKVKTNR